MLEADSCSSPVMCFRPLAARSALCFPGVIVFLLAYIPVLFYLLYLSTEVVWPLLRYSQPNLLGRDGLRLCDSEPTLDCLPLRLCFALKRYSHVTASWLSCSFAWLTLLLMLFFVSVRIYFLKKHLLLMYNVCQNSFGKSGRRSERPKALIWIWAAAELKLEKLEISVPNCLKRNSTRRGEKKRM